MATMQEVADRAGVALSTVSVMLSGARQVSPKTRAKVENAMRELDYWPDSRARALASGSPTTLALHLPRLDLSAGETVFAIAQAAYEEAAAHGYLLSVWPIAPHEAPAQLVDMVRSRRADGVILVEVDIDDTRIDALAQAGAPFVAVGRNRDTTHLNYVDIDFEAAVSDALHALHEAGRASVVLLTHHADANGTTSYAPVLRVEEAFTRLAPKLGMSAHIYRPEASPHSGRDAIATHLGTGVPFDAVVSMNEFATIGTLDALHRHALSVPNDVSLVNIITTARMSHMSVPSISSFVSPGAELGRHAARALIAALGTEKDTAMQPTQLLVPCYEAPGESLHPQPTKEVQR